MNKAIYSQNLVCDYLKSKGFVISEVNKPTSNGLDVVAIKNGKSLLIEVKSAIYSSRCWKIKKVHPKADYVAIVLPSDEIYFESADMWSRLSDSIGNQTVTQIVNLYNLLKE